MCIRDSIDAVLAVIDRCDSLVDHGVTASQIEELDFSPLLRAAQETAPDGAHDVTARREQILGVLAGLK